MAAIILDFDGTLADSFEYVVDYLAAGRKIELDADSRAEFRGLSMVGIARSLGYHWWQLPGLFISGRGSMAQRITEVPPFEGVPELLEKLHAEGHELFILSSNSVRNIHAWLHAHQLHQYFLEIYGGIGLFGKAPGLRRLLKEQHLERADAVMIGDEPRDLMAAQSLKVRALGVTWGFARVSDLDKLHPTGLADSPAALLGLLEEL